MTQRPKSQILKQTASIDRNAYEPAYSQLANILRRSMAAGILRPGDQLPSEAQLCERYDVSPMTVRRAINLLVDQGFVVAEQGRGTFVKPVAMGAATFQLRDSLNVFIDSKETTVHVLEARIVGADERVARKLDIRCGDRTIYIRRLLQTNGQPSLYHREYMVYDPLRPIVEAELEVTSLQRLFNGTGETILKRGDIHLEATILNEEEARILQASQPMAAFCFEHLFYDFDDKPISWGWFIGRADCLRLSTQVGLLMDPRGTSMKSNKSDQDLVHLLADLEEETVLEIVRERIQTGDNLMQILEDCNEGMQIVGKRYEQGEYYIAGLIMSGEIFREVVEMVQPLLVRNSDKESSGCILVGTVSGDIHDIGKNMLGMLLTCYGFTVIDLGVDVPPVEFSAKAVESKPDIVGLSGLITASFEMMRETVLMLRQEAEKHKLTFPILIGGGMIDDQVCQYVGADYWLKDAMAGVRLCQSLLADRH